jgi:hypothetical protein
MPRKCCCIAYLFLSLLLSSPLQADGPALPTSEATHEEIARAATGATLEAIPGDVLLVLYPSSPLPTPTFEMRHGGQYTQTAFIYVPQPRRPKRFTRAVTVHYQESDKTIAFRVTRLIGRLLRLHQQHFGKPATFPRAAASADVWLNAAPPARAENAGGETWTNQVYLFRTQQERSPVEWVRTIVHEWGHLTLPAARGFSSPETDAAGMLGERLYFEWLAQDSRGFSDDFVTSDGLSLYRSRQNQPLIEQFRAGGPSSPLSKRMDAKGMDYYIAGALAADAAFGSRLLGRALFSIESESPGELQRTLKEAIQNTQTLVVSLPAWVPFEAGQYRITTNQPGTIAIADRSPLVLQQMPVTLDVRIPGWKWVRFGQGGTGQIALTLRYTGRKP